MDSSPLIERLLEQVSARVGDPAAAVYARLFAESPQLQPLFAADTRGSVRGEMFMRAIDTLMDLAAGRPYAPGMIQSERVNHGHLGVDAHTFERFFHHIGAVFEEALGSDWAPETEQAWQELMDRVGAVLRGSTEPPAA